MRGKLVYVVALSALVLGSHSTSALDLVKEGSNFLDNLSGGTASQSLSVGEIAGGLKDALKVGTGNVVRQLGRENGFNNDPLIHIPLPDSLKTVPSALDKIGMSSMLDDLEVKLNRAAEQATPEAKKLFWGAIEEMTLDDVRGIYNGPDDAATRYFQKKMSAPLAGEMTPIVNNSLKGVGAIKSYDNVMGQYEKLPFVPDVKANLIEHVVELGMEGIFHYLAKEEAAIRQDPVKRTTGTMSNPVRNLGSKTSTHKPAHYRRENRWTWTFRLRSRAARQT